MTLFELKAQRELALNKADAIVKASESAGREMSKSEASEVDMLMASLNHLNPQISRIERQNTIRGMQNPSGMILTDGKQLARGFVKPRQTVFTEEYPEQFFEFIRSGGKNIGAALYEGAGSSGGYAVPIVVDDQIVPVGTSGNGSPHAGNGHSDCVGHENSGQGFVRLGHG